MSSHPTIAQLAERETVEAKQLSLGHWFESGWSEAFSYMKMFRTSDFGAFRSKNQLDHLFKKIISLNMDNNFGLRARGQGG